MTLSQRKTFMRVLPTRWRRKPAGIEIASMSPYVYELKREFASQTAAANQLRDADACDQ